MRACVPHRMNAARSWLHFGIVLLFCACQPHTAPTNDNDRTPLTSEVQRGPIRMIVTADQQDVLFGDTVTLRVDVHAPDLVGITFDQLTPGDGAGFAIRDIRRTPSTATGKDVHWQQEYLLDVVSIDTLELPSMSVSYSDARSTPAIEGQLHSEPLTIMVKSALSDVQDITQYHDIKRPLQLEPPSQIAMWLIAGLVLVTVLLIVLLRKRRTPISDLPPPMPAHLWALQRLQALQPIELEDATAIQAFYFELSDIVRGYIERRFAIMAPELTTEEFLHEANKTSVLNVEHKCMLGTFLQACDMVKFACHRPVTQETQHAFETAKDFVNSTAPTTVESSANEERAA